MWQWPTLPISTNQCNIPRSEGHECILAGAANHFTSICATNGYLKALRAGKNSSSNLTFGSNGCHGSMSSTKCWKMIRKSLPVIFTSVCIEISYPVDWSQLYISPLILVWKGFSRRGRVSLMVWLDEGAATAAPPPHIEPRRVLLKRVLVEGRGTPNSKRQPTREVFAVLHQSKHSQAWQISENTLHNGQFKLTCAVVSDHVLKCFATKGLRFGTATSIAWD